MLERLSFRRRLKIDVEVLGTEAGDQRSEVKKQFNKGETQ